MRQPSLRDYPKNDWITPCVLSSSFDCFYVCTNFLPSLASSNHIRRTLSRRYYREAGKLITTCFSHAKADAHSKALIHCNAARIDHLYHLKPIKLSTYGILFFGTPHRGTNDTALGKLVLGISSIFMPTNTKIFRQLDRDSESLSQLVDEFLPISGDFRIIFFYETCATPLVGGRSTLVRGSILTGINFSFPDCGLKRLSPMHQQLFQQRTLVRSRLGEITSLW
jgi:hypothetical protein